MKLILLPDIQETSDVPCDTGSDPEVLRKEIEEKGLPVDASLVTDGWNVKVRPLFFFFFSFSETLCTHLLPGSPFSHPIRYKSSWEGSWLIGFRWIT